MIEETERHRRHLSGAKDAAAELEQFLTGLGHRVRVYGKPPTISLQLSLMAAYHLLEAVDITQKLAARNPSTSKHNGNAGYSWCEMCEEEAYEPESHASDCPYRQAVELMGELQQGG